MVIILGVLAAFSSCSGGGGSPTYAYALRLYDSADIKSGKPYTWRVVAERWGGGGGGERGM